ncbi:Fucose permease [Micromonospora viridifaciens]|uniref:Fucose permease n=1 Tax=Micromonospora viridifaciens TaxID=1881 RepID=A0A1C4ZVF4_MICVI|nr:MFS transporter [Micromonospora viridifaciens]SCF36866.1 Fucose permease [Micromonospora viridifaciens]
MPRLTRDKTTWLTYAQLGLWGFFLYGFGPVVPLLRDEQGTSAAVAGLHSTGIAAGAILGGALFAPVARRLGRGPATWLGLAGVAVGVTALGLLRTLPATLAAVAVIATFGMMVISGVSVLLTAHHGPAAPAALTEANAAGAGMGILAPLVIGATVNAGLGWRPVMAVEVGLITLVALAALTFRVRLPKAVPCDNSSSAQLGPRSDLEPSAAADPVPVTASAAGARAAHRLPAAYWIAWVLMSVTGSIEVCLSLWTADVLRTHGGLGAGSASAAVAAIVGGMFVGRLAGGRLALRWSPVPLLLGALAVSLVGFALFWSATVGWLAVTGLVVLGLGNALHYPLAISIALAVAGPAADKAAGWASYSMGVGFGIAPVVLGWVADGVGPHLAFLLLPGFIAAAVLLTVRLGRVLRAARPAGGREPIAAGAA